MRVNRIPNPQSRKVCVEFQNYSFNQAGPEAALGVPGRLPVKISRAEAYRWRCYWEGDFP